MEDIHEIERHHGENIACLRKVLNIKQGDLADKIGMAPSQMSRIEQQSTVDDEILEKIAKAMSEKFTADTIKNYDHDKTVSYVISENSFTATGADSSQETINQGVSRQEIINNYDAGVKEMMGMLIKEKDERINDYKQQIAELKEKIQRFEK